VDFITGASLGEAPVFYARVPPASLKSAKAKGLSSPEIHPQRGFDPNLLIFPEFFLRFTINFEKSRRHENNLAVCPIDDGFCGSPRSRHE
jgi:hypothetical protein